MFKPYIVSHVYKTFHPLHNSLGKSGKEKEPMMQYIRCLFTCFAGVHILYFLGDCALKNTQKVKTLNPSEIS